MNVIDDISQKVAAARYDLEKHPEVRPAIMHMITEIVTHAFSLHPVLIAAESMRVAYVEWEFAQRRYWDEAHDSTSAAEAAEVIALASFRQWRDARESLCNLVQQPLTSASNDLT